MPKVVNHESKRRELAEAAWRTIAEHGIDSASVRAIAGQAECSTGVLAHYFPDKDALLLEALNLASARMAARMEERCPSRSDLKALRAVLHEALPLDNERRQEWRVWLSFWARTLSEPSMAEEWNQLYAGWRDLVRTLLLACQTQGTIRPDVDADSESWLIIALVDGLGSQVMSEPDALPPDRLISLVDRYLSRLTTHRDGE
jgi:AcrR family transcriptional regulator